MARRKESFASMLVHGIPWWVSACLAFVVYATMRWVAPEIRLDDPTIAYFIKSMPDAAWLGASPLLLLSGLNLYVTFWKPGVGDSFNHRLQTDADEAMERRKEL